MRARMTSILARSGLVASTRLLPPLALATGLVATVADVAGLGAASAQGREPARQEGQTPIFRAATRIVPVLTTVTDSQGRLVPSLEKEDFTVLDNGKPVELSLFLNETQPFTAVVMLDFSASMTANLDRLKSATEQFLIRLLPEDKAQVGAFSDKIQFSGHFTNDRDDLIGALRDLQFGNPTRLYDAIDSSIAELEPVPGRKVVVVFTDGDDTASRRNQGDALQRAREKETMIYAIGLESEFMVAPGRVQRTRPDRGLRKLADETGGGYFELKKTDELGPTFTRVAQELHALYTIGFTPAVMDNKEHKLEVRVKQAGMIARARKSYVASEERLSSTP
jgi:Ca-activated chloride channel family protein